MKKRPYMILALAVVCCLLTLCALPACASEPPPSQNFYYYKVKAATELNGDAFSDSCSVYYALHGENSAHQNDVLDACDAQGNPLGNNASATFQPNAGKQTHDLIFRSDEAKIGIRLLQNGWGLSSIIESEEEYYLDLSGKTHLPGIENALVIDQMRLIEGFKPGGALILSDPTEAVFTATYNAPPAFSGANAYGDYFTTQKVKVQDNDLSSVTLNGEAVAIENGEAIVTLPGDTTMLYRIAASDAVNTKELIVWMYELSDLFSPVSDLEKENVGEEHKTLLRTTLTDIQTIIEQSVNASAEEKAKLIAMEAKLKGLISRIDEAQACANSEILLKTKDITAQNAKAEDQQALENAAAVLEKALNEYGGNYNDSQRKRLEDDLARVSEALKAIAALLADQPETIDPTDLPKTGDRSLLGLWFALLVASASGICGCLVRKKERE